VLSLPGRVRIFVAREPADMRKSFDSLSNLVCEKLCEDPQSGHLFLFLNRLKDRVKMLWWDGSGYWILYKRLEEGQFHLYDQAEGEKFHYEMRRSDLMLLLEGIDLRGAKRRRSFGEKRRRSVLQV